MGGGALPVAAAMDLSLGLVVYGVILLEGAVTHVRRNPQLVRNISLAIKKQLGSVRPRGLGAKVELETLLADVTYANDLARPFPVEGGRRYHFEVGWRGNAQAFLAVSRLSMKLARLFGDVVIGVQYAGGSPGVDGFEWVLPLKTCSISTFYGHVLPLLQQVATDAEHVGAGDDAAGDVAGAGEGRGSGGSEEASEDCCICMEQSCDIVTSCGHEFCESCHFRWFQVSSSCPICRADERGQEAWAMFSAGADAPSEGAATPAVLHECIANLKSAAVQRM